MKLQPGTHLGRYEILAEIGRGGMGVVYRARDPKIDRLVAIKTISLLGQELEDAGDYRERFAFEARAAGRLSHPGIVTIFDVGEEPETADPYIVMEYVTGESLRKLLAAENKKIALRPALQLAQELAEALHYAHSQGVIHRDIKPSNILVTTGWHAKIADFGIAKLNLAQLTIPGQLLGSPAYMSPEQLRGEGVDARSDLFSLGVILYTMITGYRPFQGNSATTVCFKVVNRDPLPVTSFDAGLPAELDEIIVRAMAKDPAERFHTGAEMAEAIGDFVGSNTFSDKGSLADPESTVHVSSESTTQKSRTRTPRPAARSTPPVAPRRSISQQDKVFWGGAVLLLWTASFVLYRGIESMVPRPTVPQVVMNSSGSAAHDSVTALLTAPAAPAPTDALAGTSAPLPKDKSPIASKPERKSSASVEPATMQIEIEHPFAEAEVTIWLDNRAFYSRSLRGQTSKHALVFKQVHGHQSDSVQVPSGQHEIHVRVRAADTSFDQSRTISGLIPANGEALLHVLCDKRQDELRIALQ
ncbi:MAG: serine/threonine protein kinase [Acidobacteriaceae bacterium]|nr:serine/threonine protein kinase [Acidobacteriaceae bacterium]